MIKKVYYENPTGSYWERKKYTPYMVLIRDFEEREAFRELLEERGFKLVTWNRYYPGVLVNMELKRFGLIYRPCKHSCVDDRNYTVKEFLIEVLLESE